LPEGQPLLLSREASDVGFDAPAICSHGLSSTSARCETESNTRPDSTLFADHSHRFDLCRSVSSSELREPERDDALCFQQQHRGFHLEPVPLKHLQFPAVSFAALRLFLGVN
jgi:hypothetical protein